jgi:ABC-2 type transport system permease protein
MLGTRVPPGSGYKPMQKLFALTKNTFVETIRQPIYAIIIATAIFLFFLSPSLTMYTLNEDNKLLREICLSTLFLSSLFIAIFAASGTVAQEIENKTIVTVLSKPVQRPIFILAKFMGVAGSVILAHYICSIALLMAIRHGVLVTNVDTHDWTVITSASIALGLALLLSAFFNYVYDWKFSSTLVVLTAVFATFSMVFLLFIDRKWQFNPAGNEIRALEAYGAVLLLFAALIIAALAVVLSARFNTIVTLSGCIGVFLLGLVSDYIFGRFADTHLWAKIGRFALPNLQVFWISDALFEGSTVPFKYVLISGYYALCYIAAILFIAIALFQRRQVG